jgi:hypothetical protein
MGWWALLSPVVDVTRGRETLNEEICYHENCSCGGEGGESPVNGKL